MYVKVLLFIFVSHQLIAKKIDCIGHNLTLLQKRAYDAGIEGTDRVGCKDWWRNIPPPSATRRNTKAENCDTTNYSLHTEGRFVLY